MPCHAFGVTARVHKNQCGVMRVDQRCELIVDLLPSFVRQHRFERHRRYADLQIALTRMTAVDNDAIFQFTTGADQKFGDRCNRFLGGG